MKGNDRRERSVSCEWAELHLAAYLDGELNKKSADAMRAHLGHCPRCAAQADELHEMLTLIAACDDVAPEATLHESVMRSVREQPRTSMPRTARRPWWRVGGALAGVCLVLMLMLLPGPLMKANSPQEPAAPDHAGGALKDDHVTSGSAENESPDDEQQAPADPDVSIPDGDEAADDWAPGAAPEYGLDGDLVGEIELQRISGGDHDGDDLWHSLGGEWEGETLYLCIDTDACEVYLLTKEAEYYGDASLQNDRLLLQMENGLRLIFKVRMEGDTLWLTQLS